MSKRLWLITALILPSNLFAALEVRTDGEKFYIREAAQPPYDCIVWSATLGPEFFPRDKWLTAETAARIYGWPKNTPDELASCKRKYFVYPYRQDSTDRPLYDLTAIQQGDRVEIGRVRNFTECRPKIVFETSRSQYHETTNSAGVTGAAVCEPERIE
jgi:hypothetical protein